MFQKVMVGDFSFKDDVASVSNEAKDLICKLLDPNPVSRYTMAQVQEHAWLSENTTSELRSSYLLGDFDKFLVAHKLKMKPKHVKDVDGDILSLVEQMSS